jgi:hypothetical protein
MTYRAPVRDLAFSLRHAADFGRLADAFPEADADTVAAVLEAAGAFAADVLAPLNRQGDLVGAKLRERRGPLRARLRRRLQAVRGRRLEPAWPRRSTMAARACPRRWKWRCWR